MPGSRNSRKWLEPKLARMTAEEAADAILGRRIDAVWRGLGLLCVDRSREAEHVHQLRVATRRAVVALEIFRPLLAGKHHAWFARQLKRIRRTAGEARDLDVLSGRMAELAELAERDDPAEHVDHVDQGVQAEAITIRPDGVSHRPSSPGVPMADTPARAARRRLVEMLSRRREASRQPIEAIYEDLVEADWPAHSAGLIDRGCDRCGEPFERFAAERLRPVMAGFFKAADAPLRDADELHRLRIKGKKLRYAMEVCGVVFSPKSRRRCTAALEKLQESLGSFTDHSAAAERFHRWLHDDAALESREALRAMEADERRRADAARQRFLRWWKPSRRRRLHRDFERASA